MLETCHQIVVSLFLTTISDLVMILSFFYLSEIRFHVNSCRDVTIVLLSLNVVARYLFIRVEKERLPLLLPLSSHPSRDYANWLLLLACLSVCLPARVCKKNKNSTPDSISPHLILASHLERITYLLPL